MKRTLWRSIAVIMTTGMLSFGVTSCGDDDDEGGKSGTTGVIGAWSYNAPTGDENILVFLAEGQGVIISIPNPESESLAPLVTMDLDATTRMKVTGITMDAFSYTLPGEDGTPGTISMPGPDGQYSYEVNGKWLFLKTKGAERTYEHTRIAGTGNADDMPVGIWYGSDGPEDKTYLSIPASGMVMLAVNKSYCLPTGSSTGYLYVGNKPYPWTYRIKGKEMHLTSPGSKNETVLTFIDTKLLEGTWKTETQKASYTYTFHPFDFTEGGEGRGVATRTMKTTGKTTEFPFEYFIINETHGVVKLDSDGTEEFYQIDGKKMNLYEDGAMTKLTFELTKE